MLKFINKHLETIDSVAIYPIISLVIFVLFFGALLARVLIYKKEYLEFVKKMPLTEDENNTLL